MFPDAKFTESAAAPFTVVPTNVVPGVNRVPCAVPAKDAVPVVGIEVGGVSYPKPHCVKLDRPPELFDCCQYPRPT
jgi:hypothetical protein